MSLRSIVRELKEMRDGIGNTSRRGVASRHSQRRTKSHIVPDITLTSLEPIQQGQWANIPSELLLDIIRRVEETETSWPARAVVVSCASVCKSWRAVTQEIVQTPEECGRLTFPISLKQVINSSPLFWRNRFLLLFHFGFSVSYVLYFLFMNSRVLVILRYSASSGGTEKLLRIYCTMDWCHVSLLHSWSFVHSFFSKGVILHLNFESLENLEFTNLDLERLFYCTKYVGFFIYKSNHHTSQLRHHLENFLKLITWCSNACVTWFRTLALLGFEHVHYLVSNTCTCVRYSK